MGQHGTRDDAIVVCSSQARHNDNPAALPLGQCLALPYGLGRLAEHNAQVEWVGDKQLRNLVSAKQLEIPG